MNRSLFERIAHLLTFLAKISDSLRNSMSEFQTLQFQNSLTPWCDAHRGVRLRSVHHTAKSSSAVCIPLHEEFDYFENVKIIRILYFYFYYCYDICFFVNSIMQFLTIFIVNFVMYCCTVDVM